MLFDDFRAWNLVEIPYCIIRTIVLSLGLGNFVPGMTGFHPAVRRKEVAVLELIVALLREMDEEKLRLVYHFAANLK